MPEEFKKYFWDTEYKKLDKKKNMKYIVSRLFCEGNNEIKEYYINEQRKIYNEN